MSKSKEYQIEIRDIGSIAADKLKWRCFPPWDGCQYPSAVIASIIWRQLSGVLASARTLAAASSADSRLPSRGAGATVERLMDGQTAALCFTSPPYNLGNNSLGGNKNRVDSKYLHDDDDRPQDEYRVTVRPPASTADEPPGLVTRTSQTQALAFLLAVIEAWIVVLLTAVTEAVGAAPVPLIKATFAPDTKPLPLILAVIV